MYVLWAKRARIGAMPPASEPVRGACLCGAVTLEVTPPTAFCAHCHCTLCRLAHGAGYVTWFGVAKERFRILSGEKDLVHYRSSPHGIRSFCGTCGSSLFCELDTHPGLIDVVLANLSGPIDREPQGHFYFSDKAEWVEVEDGLPRFGGDSGMEPL
jgi:hypothetical protein